METNGQTNEIEIPDEVLMNKIYLIRGHKVMLDRDLSDLYGVETKRLKEAVKRNIERFPEDFMFELTKREFENWRSQIASSKSDRMGLRYAPFCFTEQGVTMLSCVLSSKRAIEVNIRIIRIFTKMREMLATHKDILHKLEELERNGIEHDKKIELIFEYLNQFEEAKQQELKQKERPLIGFKSGKE
jgi:hypothetical protein